ncbi:MAG: DNA polymerase III subunit gamma/tau [Muribaculaceae bacterium]|nr:DNA polymerase III subunit gamma/tau [Muribaculaceae bacterium]
MSEKYIVSARKYRPATFDTVIGQQALTHTLKTAIASESLAHAYLFCGSRGVGKTTCARIFAKAINCEHLTPEGEPCNECESCRAFNEQRSYNIMELDAASNNTVDDIHTVIKQVQIPPQVGRYRVFIIDEVHMLSNQAFNAFLKTLEEPPEYAIFILATTEKQKIIPTILSRCQIYDFARITVPDIVDQLQRICADKGITAEPAALNIIAQKADGAMRDALSIFDQVAASSGGNITYETTLDNLNVLDHDFYFRLDESFLNCDVPGALLIYKEIRDKGFDSQFFINGLAQHLRDLMVASTPQTAKLLEMNDDVAQRHVVEAAKFAPRFYYAAMDLCNTCDLNYRNASNKQFLVELTLVKLCQLLATAAPLTPQPQPKVQKIATATATAPATAQHATAQPATSQPRTAAQQPQQQAAPATHSTAPQRATSARPAATATATPRIYINNPAAAAAQQQQATANATSSAPTAHRNSDFSEQDLARAWQQYIDTHPHEQLVITTMRQAIPTRVNSNTYRIAVGSKAEQTVIEGAMPRIVNDLRAALNNDMLAIEVELKEVAINRHVMTDREIVEDLKQRNPQFIQLIKDFDLSLA